MVPPTVPYRTPGDTPANARCAVRYSGNRMGLILHGLQPVRRRFSSRTRQLFVFQTCGMVLSRRGNRA